MHVHVHVYSMLCFYLGKSFSLGEDLTMYAMSTKTDGGLWLMLLLCNCILYL